MPLHPVASQLLGQAAASDQPNSHQLPVEVARENFERNFIGLPVAEVWSVHDVAASTAEGEVPLRIYRPADAATLPLVYYIHGGGWQMGSLDSHDGICRALSNATGAAVVSVEYRRPPEHKFPAALTDCVAALRWVVAHADTLGLDARAVALVGDSAGGNLAAGVALSLRNADDVRMAGQALLYPATTFDLDLGFDMEFEGMVLFRDEVQWHKDAYFADPVHALAPLASPLNADVVALPPTLIVTAEFDPLHAQGELLYDKLRAAGVPAELVRFPGMIHGFAQFPNLFEQADDAVERVAVFLRDHLAGAQ